MMMAGSKIVLPSSDVEEYFEVNLRQVISRIVNPQGLSGLASKKVYGSDNCPSWWPKDVAFVPVIGQKAPSNGITHTHLKKILAAFLEKCPDQYTISPPDEVASKIVLPSSDVDEYIELPLRRTISRIVNPEGLTGISSKKVYMSENCPKWWPNDVVFSPVLGRKAITVGHLRKILAAFLEKCPEQYTISPPIDQQNSASTDLKDQLIGTKRARRKPRSKIVLPSSNAEEYSGIILRGIISRIANPKGRKGRYIYINDNRPSWWPKDVAFSSVSGPKAIANGITVGNMRMVLASFLEKCPEQYTITPRKRLLNPTSSPLVGDNQPVREVSPQSSSESSSESDQEEPVGMNQTPPTGANRTRSVGATISTAAQHASPKLILPSSCANDYSQPSLMWLIRKNLNPQRRNFIYSSANCPSWWPTDVPFIRAEDMKAKDRRKVLTAFLKKCPEQYTISPPVDQRNSPSTVETNQPEDTIVDVETNEDSTDEDIEGKASIPSDPEDLLNSLEQHLLDSRKRSLEAERKVEELTEENKRLKEEMKSIGSIVKRSRLHH